MSEIDVLHHWLGIPPQDQPPTLYRLLGLVDFESDQAVIRSAAERQAMHVRRLARGEYVDAGQELLNEIASAKLQLIDDEKRAAYDLVLKSSRDPQELPVERDGNAAEQEPMPDPLGTVQADPEGLFEKGLYENRVKPPKVPSNKATVPEIRATSIDDSVPVPDHRTLWRINKVKGTRLDPDQWDVQRGESLLLGYHPDCDVRIDHPTVSGMHCRLGKGITTWQVSDLKSTNGTFVNGRKVQKAFLARNDLLVVGGDHRVLLPRDWFGPESTLASVMFIGRSVGNEIVIGSKRVSRFHARIIMDNDLITVEDLNSARGTRLIRAGEGPIQIARCNVRPGDVLQFGDVNVSVAEMIQAIDDFLDQS